MIGPKSGTAMAGPAGPLATALNTPTIISHSGNNCIVFNNQGYCTTNSSLSDYMKEIHWSALQYHYGRRARRIGQLS